MIWAKINWIKKAFLEVRFGTPYTLNNNNQPKIPRPPAKIPQPKAFKKVFIKKGVRNRKYRAMAIINPTPKWTDQPIK
tara:strand:+ start:169 stop:402 length:234 start_codon:yes stop_codon:yes gene_type:complete